MARSEEKKKIVENSNTTRKKKKPVFYGSVTGGQREKGWALAGKRGAWDGAKNVGLCGQKLKRGAQFLKKRSYFAPTFDFVGLRKKKS